MLYSAQQLTIVFHTSARLLQVVHGDDSAGTGSSVVHTETTHDNNNAAAQPPLQPDASTRSGGCGGAVPAWDHTISNTGTENGEQISLLPIDLESIQSKKAHLTPAAAMVALER
jgi:hypothetical protein